MHYYWLIHMEAALWTLAYRQFRAIVFKKKKCHFYNVTNFSFTAAHSVCLCLRPQHATWLICQRATIYAQVG